MAINISFEEPIEVDGQTIILTSDEVNDVASDASDAFQILGDSKHHAPIWASERSVASAREAHPEVPVYGLWQLLLSADLVDFDDERAQQSKCGFVLWTSEHSGHLLIVENGKATASAQFATTQMVSMYGISTDDLIEISLTSLDDLSFDADQILMPRELADRMLSVTKRRQLILGAAFLLVVGGAFALNIALEQHKHAVEKAIRDKTGELVSIQAQIVTTKARKLSLTPDDHHRAQIEFSRLAELTRVADGLKIDDSDLKQPITATVDKFSANLSFPIKVASNPKGDLQLQFSADGSADSQ